MVQQQYFSIGKRTYFVVFELGDINSETTISYGAAVKRYNGPRTRLRERAIKQHFSTAMERFKRFPVQTTIRIPDRVRTRSDLSGYLSSRRFHKRFVNKFCQEGVRSRHDYKDSLMDKQLRTKRCQIIKKRNRAVDMYNKELARHKEQHRNDSFSRATGGEIEISDWEHINAQQAYLVSLSTQGRIFHVAYKRDSDGEMIYGACVFHPKTREDLENYNMDEHYLTAMDRLEFCPVAVRIVPTHEYPTRFAESGEMIRPDEFRSLRKKIAKYGVRVSENGPRFIREHELKTEMCRVKKKYNRQLMGVLMQENERRIETNVSQEIEDVQWSWSTEAWALLQSMYKKAGDTVDTWVTDARSMMSRSMAVA